MFLRIVCCDNNGANLTGLSTDPTCVDSWKTRYGFIDFLHSQNTNFVRALENFGVLYSTPKVACIMCLWVWLKVLGVSTPAMPLSRSSISFQPCPKSSLQALAVVAVVGLQSRPAHAVRSTKAKNPEQIICWQPWKWLESSLVSGELSGQMQLRHFTPMSASQLSWVCPP